jgi:hypothetical protein
VQQASGRSFKNLVEPLFLSADDYSKGQPFDVALVSTDETIKAYAKVIPFPIEAEEGRCRLWVELASPKADGFLIQGEGFEPDEEVTTTSRSNGEVLEGTHKVPPDGKLFAVVLPVVIGKQEGVP